MERSASHLGASAECCGRQRLQQLVSLALRQAGRAVLSQCWGVEEEVG